jgi:endonuclease/exonuclease/phosphatase (EEP) superfamily protein YafD
VKLISWNLLHKGGATLDSVERLIAAEQPRLLLLQETLEALDALPLRVGGHYARVALPGKRHGLAAWSPEPFIEAPADLVLQPGILVRRVCQIVKTRDFSVANVHLSHGQLLNRRQLRRISQILSFRAAIVGDCNMVGAPFLKEFRDVGPRRPTHAMAGLLPLRIDRCFVRGLDCAEARLLDRGPSDHHPILVKLGLPGHTSAELH